MLTKTCRPAAMGLLVLLLLLCSFRLSYAQSSTAKVEGIVKDEWDNRLEGVSITILGRHEGTTTGPSGEFSITVPAGKAFALFFSHTAYKTVQKNFLLNHREEEYIEIVMTRESSVIDSVVITSDAPRREAGLIAINPKYAINIPSPVGGIESLIKIFVGSNNELTSQYSVRGGSYDENLIYINDFEVFRPYLVRSGQQEGLSFINPELTKNVKFYNGGFQARYGDKMSSVLDIHYKTPEKFAGSAYIGLLEQGLHFEGINRKKTLSYLIGARNKSNRNLLSSQETKGNYIPSSSDLQVLLKYGISQKSDLEFLGILSGTSFTLEPEFSQLTSSVFSPFFSANLGLDIYFQGKEKDRYSTAMGGIAYTLRPDKNLRLKFMASSFLNRENEAYDIMGAYLFGEREFDKSKPDFGLINNPLGTGLFHTYARNYLDIYVHNLSHKGSYNFREHYFQWGLAGERQVVHDRLNEWEYQDSTGYNLPYNPDALHLSKVLKSKANFSVNRISGYVQDNIAFGNGAQWSVQAGLRFNYNNLNKEFLLSPRVGLSWNPFQWKRDIVFKASAGAYHQPPFYRELRKYDGEVNFDLLAQKSWQVTAGMDYQFTRKNMPFRLSTEVFYKHMRDVVPYDIDNVRLRYHGTNNADAYAAGLEMRLFGELVKDAESWISLGIMSAKENLHDDFFYRYTLDENNQPTDSTLMEGGWYRRPTDKRVSFGMFLQDYLSTNQNFKVYLNLLYGSNLSYNIPNEPQYRNALIIEPYMRIDIGFSALLLNAEKSARRSHHPFKNFENIWLTLEVFNLIDRDNTISYLLIKDFSNTTFAMPNRLTPRLLNLKLVARF